MEISERARAALRPTNTLHMAQEPVRSAPASLHGASMASASGFAASAPVGTAKIVRAGQRATEVLEPPSFAKTYYIEDRGRERRYFDDYQRTSLAMRATDTSISSKREDLDTIRAMFDLAQARGWRTVEVRGSASFKREAWIEATARGLETRGFTASEPERQEAQRRRTEREPGRTVNESQASADPVRDAAPPQVIAPLVHDPATAVTAARARASGKRMPDSSRTDKPEAAQRTPRKPTLAEKRQALLAAQKELSPDGRLVLAALSEKIDRQMNRRNAQVKSELKAFVVSELIKKERAEGPIVLSAEQKQAAHSPEPAPSVPSAPTRSAVFHRHEPESPRRTLSR